LIHQIVNVQTGNCDQQQQQCQQYANNDQHDPFPFDRMLFCFFLFQTADTSFTRPTILSILVAVCQGLRARMGDDLKKFTEFSKSINS
jgi:hypothetical protein